MRAETRHSIVLVAGTGVTATLALVYTVYAQRVLGPQRSADFVTALSFVALCYIALGPINGTVARFTARFAGDDELGKVRALFTLATKRVAMYLLIGLVLGVLGLKPLAKLLQFDSVGPLLLAYAIVYATLLLSVVRGVLRGMQQFGRLNINTISESTLRLTVGVVLLAFWTTAPAGLTAYFIALVGILAFSRLQLRRIWGDCEASPIDAREILRFGLPMFAMMITSAGFQNVDMLAVKHYFAPVEAGVYGAAFTLGKTTSALVTPFTTLLLPLMTAMHQRGQAITGSFVRLTLYFLALAAVPLFLFALWPAFIVSALFGAGFTGAGALLVPVTVARLLGHLCHMLALAAAAMGRFRFLYIYVPELCIQLLALILWHESLSQVAAVLVVIHATALVAMIAAFYIEIRMGSS